MQRDSHGETMLEQTHSVSESSENAGLRAGAQNVTVHFGLNKNTHHPASKYRAASPSKHFVTYCCITFIWCFASPVCTNWEQFGGSGSCSRTLKKNCRNGQNVCGVCFVFSQFVSRVTQLYGHTVKCLQCPSGSVCSNISSAWDMLFGACYKEILFPYSMLTDHSGANSQNEDIKVQKKKKEF